jgi:hypothetical protein
MQYLVQASSSRCDNSLSSLVFYTSPCPSHSAVCMWWEKPVWGPSIATFRSSTGGSACTSFHRQQTPWRISRQRSLLECGTSLILLWPVYSYSAGLYYSWWFFLRETFTAFISCLDVTSTHVSTTDNYVPNVTTTEGYDLKTIRPRDIKSAIRYGLWIHVYPWFDLEVLSHLSNIWLGGLVTLDRQRQTSFTCFRA